MAATLHKTPTVRPPTFYHENYSILTNQTCRTLLEKHGRTHKRLYSYGPPHMAVQKQDDQHEHTFSSYVRVRDVALKTCLGRWTIGRSGERGSGISVLSARHDDDFYFILLFIMSRCQLGFPWLSLVTRLERVKGFTGLYRLWVRPYFSSSVPRVCFV